MKKKSKKSGFTLMEIVTVMLIIGILLALATPQFFKTRFRGHTKVLTAILRSIWAAERAYYQVDGHYFPDVGGSVSDLDTINNYLRTDFVEGKWDIVLDPATGGNYTATATMQAGMWGGAPLVLKIGSTQEDVTCESGPCTVAGF